MPATKGDVVKLVVASFLNQLADTLANAKTVMTWMMVAIGAPTAVIGMLVPIREAGALIPQIFVSGTSRTLPRRKYLLAGSIFVQALCIAAICFLARGSNHASFTAAIILMFVALYSVSRSISSLSGKDVLAKIIEKGKRGSLLGWSSTLVGVSGICFGISLINQWVAPNQSYVVLLLIASICFLASAITYALVDEPNSEIEAKRPLSVSLAAGWHLFADDARFRAYIRVRALLVSSSLSSPYLVVLLQSSSEKGTLAVLLNLGSLVVITGFASLISAKFWGKFADRDSRRVLASTALLTSFVCVIASMLSMVETSAQSLWIVMLFLVLSVVHQGVRIGRVTYVLDIAEGSKRSDYIAVSNTIIGVVLIVVGMLGAFVAQSSVALVLLMFACLSLTAFFYCRLLASPDVA